MDARTAYLQSPEGEIREVAEKELTPYMVKGWKQVDAPSVAPEEEKGKSIG
jgi:hypothetical protein